VSILGALVTPRASIESPTVPISSSSILEFLGIKPTAAGVMVNEQSSLAMPAVWRAVSLLAGTPASLPLKAYKRGDETLAPLLTGQAFDLLDNPHPDLVPYDFWELVYGHRLLWGNAYILKLRDALGRIKELWPIHPSRVKVGRVSADGALGDSREIGRKVYAVDGGLDAGGMTLHDEEIMHLPGFGYDGIAGISPIAMARQGIGLALSAEEYGARLFAGGSLAAGILQTDQKLRPEQADALQARWKQKASGLAHAHEAVVLDAGVKWHQLTIPPEDAQFLESRKFQVVEIARMFGIPPHMLMDVDGSTSWGTGIAEQTLGFVIFSMQNWLIRTEQRMTQVLRPQNVYAKYSIQGLLRGDPKTRAEFYTKLWNLGVLSTNDIRRFEEMAPVEGGDIRYRPLNMGILGQSDPVKGGNPPTPTPEAAQAKAIAEIAQKVYLAVDGNKILTTEEGRVLLNAAGAGLDPDSPFPEESEPEPAQLPPAPEPNPAEPEQETVDA
jgi:HK97 family phage portal protein